MRREGIICAGNWIVDVVHAIDSWPAESDLARITSQDIGVGGGAANVAFSLSRMDRTLPLWPMGAVGGDDYGRFVLEACRNHQLPEQFLKVDEKAVTAHTHVMSASGKSRTFFYHGGANDNLCVSDFPVFDQSLAHTSIFYLGYLMLMDRLDAIDEHGGTGASKVLAAAKEAGMTTCVDLVSAERADYARSVSVSLPMIDYLIVNEVEAARACGRGVDSDESGKDIEDLKRLGKTLLEGGVRCAVIIHCPERAVWVGRGGLIESAQFKPVPADQIASPVGAGDAFCAGILYALHARWDPQAALALAHETARSSLTAITATDGIPDLKVLLSAIV